MQGKQLLQARGGKQLLQARGGRTAGPSAKTGWLVPVREGELRRMQKVVRDLLRTVQYVPSVRPPERDGGTLIERGSPWC